MADNKSEGEWIRQTHSQVMVFYGEHLEKVLLRARIDASGHRLCAKRLDKVPPDMRQANPSDYEPIFFRFGLSPSRFHLQPSSILPCDYYKIDIARALTTQASFEAFLTLLVARMGDIWKLYGEHRDHADGERPFALILALDALTVVAAACYQECVSPRSMCPVIWRDVFLLEQQLPLFVIEAALHCITFDTDSDAFSASSGWSSSDCASSGVSDDCMAVTMLDHDQSKHERGSHAQIKDVINFYALQTSYPFIRDVRERRQRQCLLPPLDMEQSLLRHIHTSLIADGHVRRHHVVSTKFTSLPTASRLRAYGIRFAVGGGGFDGIKFDRRSRVLTLPEITMFNTTKCYMLNLVAQEVAVSCYDDDPSPVSSYIFMMGFLIDTEEDVRVLVDAHVVYNHLGSPAEVAAMWKSLGVNLPISLTWEDSIIIDAVRETCEQQRLRSMTRHCLHNKLSWLVIAVLLLALMCLQTTIIVRKY